MEWAAKILLSIKGENIPEIKCKHSIINKRDKRFLIIKCKECNGNSSRNDDICRSNALKILLEEPAVDRLVLSNLY